MNLQSRTARIEDASKCGLICFEAFKAFAEQHNFPPGFPSPEIASGLMLSLLTRQDI